jgi:hypothetical protein
MEDRVSPGLYLELVNLAPDAYRARVDTLLGSPGVHRVSWWENSLPGRDELPMRIPDGSLLGLAEVDDTFAPTAAPDAATAFHFRRHPARARGS